MNETVIDSRPKATRTPPVVTRARRIWPWVGVLVVLVLLAQFVHSAVTNRSFLWDVFAQYFFSGPIMSGLLLTVEVTAVGMVIGIVLGTIVSVMRMSSNRLLSGIALCYTWLFRGLPILVILLLFFNLAALYPQLSLGIPFGPIFASGRTNALITAFVAGSVGLGLHEAAYMAEIIRGGILSVDAGQWEAAAGLGMTRTRTFVRVILPQAMRFIVPPAFNNISAMLKSTAMISVLALSELLYASEQIMAKNFAPIPMLLVAAVWYLLCTSVLMVVQYAIERRFNRHDAGRHLAGSGGVRIAQRGFARTLETEVAS
jgi:polar amino acid transport system permease protein